MRSGLFPLGDYLLHGGQTIPEAQIGYGVAGELNQDRTNLILIPTSYGARHQDLAWMVGPLFDPDRYCIVIVDMFCNGVSSSPSHGAMGLAEQGWVVSHRDNVAAQRRLLAACFEVDSPALIYGWSMGAQQAYQWAVRYPNQVKRLCCVCGTGRPSNHNQLFLLSLRHALLSDRHWNGSSFDAEPLDGLRTYALIYASWASSQPFYNQIDQPMEEYVEEQWLPHYRRHDPRDLIAMIDTWLEHDVVGQLPQIQAKTALVAANRDLYFTVDDMAADAALIPNCTFVQIDSLLGHRAGNPHGSEPEQRQLRAVVDQLLSN
jgi:homoserine O-acetyltransferase